MSTKEAPQRHRDADDEALLMGARETVMAFESVAWWLLLCAGSGVRHIAVHVLAGQFPMCRTKARETALYRVSDTGRRGYP